MFKVTELSDMVGKTYVSVTGSAGDEVMRFTATDGTVYTFDHNQNCRESVSIEDVIGDLDDLVGQPLLMAEEATNSESNPEGVTKSCQDSFTWTFYKFATVKGYVTVRWYGESNGWYSESVDISKQEPKAA